MGKGGGGTTVTKTEPWDEQKKFLQTGFQATNVLADPWLVRDKNGNITGLKTVNNALAPAYYSGNTVAPQSAWTTQALQMQAQAAQNMAKDPTMKAANSAAKQIANGTALANNAGLAQLQSLAKSAPITQHQALNNNSGMGTLNALAGQATGAGNAGLTALNKYATQNFNSGNAALKNLQGTTGAGINSGNAALAQLNMLAQNDNPYMDSLYKRANNQAQASLDSNFNRSGRYGSGSHEAAAADAANNLADQMYSNLYNQRINAANAASSSYLQGMNEGINAQQAAGQLFNQGQQLGVSAAQDAANAFNTALGQRINAAQGAGSLYNTGIGNLINAYGQQADAAGAAANAYNTGVGQRAAAAQIGQQLANQRYTDAAMLSEAGGVKDDYQQQLINAAIDRYNYNAQRPLQALSTYNQLISGNYGGTSTAQGQQASGSRLGNALGGALGGAGLVSALATNPAGWMIGAGAGLGGLLGLL